MVDYPDVNPNSYRSPRAVPGTGVMAQDYVNTLTETKQRQSRELELRGELRIAPDSDLCRPGPFQSPAQRNSRRQR